MFLKTNLRSMVMSCCFHSGCKKDSTFRPKVTSQPFKMMVMAALNQCPSKMHIVFKIYSWFAFSCPQLTNTLSEPGLENTFFLEMGKSRPLRQLAGMVYPYSIFSIPNIPMKLIINSNSSRVFLSWVKI